MATTAVNNCDNNHQADADPYDKAISAKAEEVGNKGLGVLDLILEKAVDAFDPVDNPKGNVRLAVADNKVCEDIMVTKMTELSKESDPTSSFFYGDPRGNLEFRQALQRFFTKYFKALHAIDADSIFVCSGTTPIIETLAFAFCEPGGKVHYDFVAILSPNGAGCIRERAGAGVVQVPSSFRNPDTGFYDAAIKDGVLEDCYQKATQEGKKILAILFVNPTNPTGDVFTVDQINTLLEFAKRHELHVISNEIYGLTVFDPEVEFTSILSIPWPDPGRVHFCWGFSKDFGLSGYHIGALLTRNPRLQRYLKCSTIYTQAVSAVQHKFQRLISDEDWLDNVFLPTLRSRLRERFESVHQALTPLGVKVHKSVASVFAWMDMSQFLPSQTEEGEVWLFEQLVAGGVLLIPGVSARAPAYGFYRIILTQSSAEHTEGVKRMCSIISSLSEKA